METNSYHGWKPREDLGFMGLEFIQYGYLLLFKKKKKKITDTKLDVNIYFKKNNHITNFKEKTNSTNVEIKNI